MERARASDKKERFIFYQYAAHSGALWAHYEFHHHLDTVRSAARELEALTLEEGRRMLRRV